MDDPTCPPLDGISLSAHGNPLFLSSHDPGRVIASTPFHLLFSSARLMWLDPTYEPPFSIREGYLPIEVWFRVSGLTFPPVNRSAVRYFRVAFVNSPLVLAVFRKVRFQVVLIFSPLFLSRVLNYRVMVLLASDYDLFSESGNLIFSLPIALSIDSRPPSFPNLEDGRSVSFYKGNVSPSLLQSFADSTSLPAFSGLSSKGVF